MATKESNVSGFSVRELMKKRLLNDMIRFVQPPGKWKILVVDPLSMRILSSSLKMYDILEENVTLVEMINKNRQPYPNLEAVYFLSPTPEAISYLISDFSSSGANAPMYAAAHLFFISALPDSLMKRITNSTAARYIKNMKELFVDFLPLEQRVFTFNSPASFFKLYSPDSGGLLAQNQELDRLAKKLVSYLATIGDAPAIRYFQPNNQSNVRCGKFAHMVAAEIEALMKMDPGYPSPDNLKGTLLILDRSFDVTAPILHEFTYQAMTYDLLPLVDGNKYMYSEGTEGKKEATLDENDSLWIEFRHSHIADTIRLLMEQFNKFISENKAANAALGGGK
ncbi:Syntaxin-binding protein 1, partial [Coelomomyces lativittatus]